MLKGWRNCRLGEVIELKRGYDLPQRERQAGSYPVISSSGFSDAHAKAKVKGPGVVTGRYGTIGTVYFVEGDYWPLNTTLYVQDFKGNDPRFVSYFLRGVDFHAYSDKAAVPGVNRNHLHEAQILCPPLPEQHAIASILSALDDKIEMNRRMNETLEAMARAIFRDWFVTFGPTRAKQEGRTPYLAPDIWSLFPARLDGDGKPEGWAERRVEEIMELAYGKALKASERVNGPIPVYGSGGITGYHSEALVEGPSIIVGRKGTVGSLYWEDCSFFPIDTVFFVKPKAPLTFCYYHLQTLGLEGMNTDAAVPGLNRNNVYRLPVPWSSEELRTQFDETVTAFRQRMSANSKENETLAATRDLLLPKLMSGEVRVKYAEKIAGDVV